MPAAVEGLVRIRVTRADEHTPLPQPGSVSAPAGRSTATTLQDGYCVRPGDIGR